MAIFMFSGSIEDDGTYMKTEQCNGKSKIEDGGHLPEVEID